MHETDALPCVVAEHGQKIGGGQALGLAEGLQLHTQIHQPDGPQGGGRPFQLVGLAPEGGQVAIRVRPGESRKAHGNGGNEMRDDIIEISPHIDMQEMQLFTAIQ